VIENTSSRPPEEQLIFINAWNEWGEGSYLEPDFKHGRAYLEATREALLNSGIEVSTSGTTDEDMRDQAPAPYEKLYGDLVAKYERLQRRYQEQLSLEERSPLVRKAEQRAIDLQALHERMTAQNERLRARNEGLEHHNTELENAIEAQRRRSLRAKVRNLLKQYAPSVERRMVETLHHLRHRSSK
jgi:cell division protein FtsB